MKNFKSLNQRDAEWLKKILNGDKYETIAIEYNMTLGTVKNRFKIIFNEIKVKNKQDFLNTYFQYEIWYANNEIK